jgi:integrase
VSFPAGRHLALDLGQHDARRPAEDLAGGAVGAALLVTVRLDRAAGPGHPGRLDAGNVARASHGVGCRAGVPRGTNPHGLRHQGITRALDLAHGDVRKVRRFSRHAKLETLLKHDDNRVDEAGAIAKMLEEDSERTE